MPKVSVHKINNERQNVVRVKAAILSSHNI